MKIKPYLKSNGEKIILNIYLQPGAKKSEITGEYNDRLKIRIQAPPVEGKANEALINFLSDKLDLPKNKISLLRGEKSREKDICIVGLDLESVTKKMLG